jgi:nicotinamidase-related amidase
MNLRLDLTQAIFEPISISSHANKDARPYHPAMKSALLVIDVQRGLFDKLPRPHEAEAVVDRINSLAARARDARVPVVFIHHETQDGELEYGTENWQLAQRLRFEAGDVTLRKTTPDSFLRTDLSALLTAWSATRLVICGYASEFCVDTTTRRAAALGFPVVLAADAHTTHDKDHAPGAEIRKHHNATLSNIESFGPRIEALAAAEIVFEI